MAKCLAVGNQKGGVGKTTTALNLGHALAERERRVLLVDLDPQASLTIGAGAGDCAGRSMAEVLAGSLKLSEILCELRPGLALAPADIELSRTEIQLIGEIGREQAVKTALDPIRRKYDYILLDLPPSLSILTIAGLAAADLLLIPAIPQYLDLRALAIFSQTVATVQKRINPGLRVLGVLPTFYDGRLRLHADILQAWESSTLPLLPIQVRRSVRVAESPISGRPVAEISPEHGEVYYHLAEIVENA